jgi:hypothetical protein
MRLALLLALLAAPALAQTAPPPASDYAAVERTVGYYLDGGTQGDVDLLARAFHPDATMRWVADGEMRDVNAVAFFRGGMRDARPSDRVTRVVDVTVTGDAATATLEIEYPTFTFVDHMTLLKLDGGWLIVSKAFTRRPHAHGAD